MPLTAMPPHRFSVYENYLSGEAISKNYDDKLESMARGREGSEFWRSIELFQQAQRQLSGVAVLRPNWDSYGAEVPNDRAKEVAERVLDLLRHSWFPPTRVVASSEGGIGICFVQGDKYADLECFNTGEIVAVSYRGMEEPHVWEVPIQTENITEAIDRIRAELTS